MHLLYPNPTSVKFMGQCQVPEQAYIKAGLPPYLKGGWAKSGSLSSAKLNPSECIFGLAFFLDLVGLGLTAFWPNIPELWLVCQSVFPAWETSCAVKSRRTRRLR